MALLRIGGVSPVSVAVGAAVAGANHYHHRNLFSHLSRGKRYDFCRLHRGRRISCCSQECAVRTESNRVIVADVLAYASLDPWTLRTLSRIAATGKEWNAVELVVAMHRIEMNRCRCCCCCHSAKARSFCSHSLGRHDSYCCDCLLQTCPCYCCSSYRCYSCSPYHLQPG